MLLKPQNGIFSYRYALNHRTAIELYLKQAFGNKIENSTILVGKPSKIAAVQLLVQTLCCISMTELISLTL